MAMVPNPFIRYDSLGEALRGSCERYADRIALVEADREAERGRWSYRRVREEAEGFAARLQDRGFQPGARCAVILSNQAKWLISATGVFWAGGVLVPLDYKLNPEEWLRLLRHSEPEILVTEWQYWQKLLAAGWPQGNLRVFVTDAPPGTDLQGAIRWEQGGSGFRYVLRSGGDLAAIVYSSGTGGDMKGCMLSHYNYLSQLEQYHRRARMHGDDRYFSFLPTNHAIDFVFGFLYPLNIGAMVVHQRTLRPQFLLPTFRKYRITVTSMVPMLLALFKAQMEAKFAQLSGMRKLALKVLVALNRGLTRSPHHRISRVLLNKIHDEFGGRLRLIMTGGAFVDPALAKFFYDLGFFVGIGYGLTEAGTAVSAPDWGKYRCDTVGKVLDDTQVRIDHADEAGIGEIWVKGPSVMQGYWKEPALTAETLVDGWLRTGDLGKLEADRSLRIVGRSKNMIVTEGGKNIYPEDVESRFGQLSECEEMCVFSRSYLWPDHPLNRDQLLMVLRPKEGAEREQMADLIARCNRQLPHYQRVSSYLIWNQEFPRTASMKIKRHHLAAAIRSGSGDAQLKELAS